MENYGNFLAILRNVAVVGSRGEVFVSDTCGAVELWFCGADLWIHRPVYLLVDSMVTAGAAPGTRIVES